MVELSPVAPVILMVGAFGLAALSSAGATLTVASSPLLSVTFCVVPRIVP